MNTTQDQMGATEQGVKWKSLAYPIEEIKKQIDEIEKNMQKHTNTLSEIKILLGSLPSELPMDRQQAIANLINKALNYAG